MFCPPISTLANNKRSCSKKWKIRPKLRVSVFSGQNFVTPFSTFANNKRSYPTNSTTLDRLRIAINIKYPNRRRRYSRFLQIFCSSIAKTFFKRIPDLELVYTTKEAHSRIFVTEVSFFVRQVVAKKIASWGGELVQPSMYSACHKQEHGL